MCLKCSLNKNKWPILRRVLLTMPALKFGKTNLMTTSQTSGLWAASSIRCARFILPSRQMTSNRFTKRLKRAHSKQFLMYTPKSLLTSLFSACIKILNRDQLLNSFSTAKEISSIKNVNNTASKSKKIAHSIYSNQSTSKKVTRMISRIIYPNQDIKEVFLTKIKLKKHWKKAGLIITVQTGRLRLRK
jgi:hypothetical protein